MFFQSAILLLSVGAIAAPVEPRAIPTTVDLGYSKYQGLDIGGIKQWLGIRYAAPPIGDLRWRAPQDPVNTTTVQSATAFTPVCAGVAVSFGPATPTSEDCLTLNVFTPSNATETSKLPVWFFIQGGGYSANSDADYNGTAVINRSGGNVVYVEINYRVGAFGFLASNKIKANGDLNAGFLDQRKALQWVQSHISKFGGDPNHVVIHGDSAGAGSVALHLVAYNGRDDKLFVGGIGESIFFPTQRTVADLEFQYSQFLNLTGCTTATDSLACIRAKDSTALQKASSSAGPYPNATAAPYFPYAPCVDGDLLTDYPLNLYKNNKFIKVPVMIGDDNDEGTYFVSNAASAADVSTFMHNQFPHLTQDNLTKINELYPLTTAMASHSAYYPSLEQAYGESTFTCPGLIISAAISTNYASNKVWNYRYNVQDNGNVAAGLGVPHVEELPAILGIQGSLASYSTYNAEIVPIVMDFWLNFIRFLDPNGVQGSGKKEMVSWENFAVSATGLAVAQQRLKLQTNATEMESVPAAQLTRCQFWSDAVPWTQN